MAKSFVSAAVLFFCFIVSFVLSVIFSYITWNDYVQSKQPWMSADCVVANTSIDDCSNGHYRVLVEVLEFQFGDSLVSGDEDHKLTATQTSDIDNCPYDNKPAAEKYRSDFRINETTECYTDGDQVRLTPGGASKDEISLYKLRAIFPIIACIVSGLTLCYSIYHISAVYRVARNVRNGHARDSDRDFADDFSQSGRHPRSSPYLTLDRPPRVGYTYGYRRPLSGHDARLLIAALQEKPASGEANGTCPICLEDFEDGAGKKSVELPCTHEYHEDCALQWFRKGSCSCPYCNYDLMGDVRGVREKAAREESEGQETDRREVQEGREGAQEEREGAQANAVDGDEASSGSFVVSQYPWSWAWWMRETTAEERTST